AYSDWRSKDFAYKTRHTEIAQIVFDEAFPQPMDKANQLARILRSLNSDYSSDAEAASRILKGRVIADEFGDRSLAERIFEAAEQAGIDQSFVYQQRALFELKHPGGSAVRALKFIDLALDAIKGAGGSIHHTKAVVLRDLARAEEVDSALAVRYQENALAELKDNGLLKTSYSVVTYCEVLIDQIKVRVGRGGQSGHPLSEEVAVRKMSELERSISEGLQRWPDDSYLVNLRSELFTIMNEHPQALLMLRKAFSKTPANEFVALRLSRQLMDSENAASLLEAKGILRSAVKQNASSKALNFQLARLLIREGEAENAQEISKLLRRSYTDGDTHFEAQFVSARHEFLYGSRDRANQIYAQLNSGPVPNGSTTEKRGMVRNEQGMPQPFEGVIKTLKGDYGFVDCASLGAVIFLTRSEMKSGFWTSLRLGDPLTFKVAFSYRGPCCIDALV
ncbi:tetratricopeptide repeat protein, partial [Pseudomonas lurida]|uniref:tetratricopeptide repeat protein n=1 Tax=Pseudomonas lurida TaxID=244566 RepID=UPI001F4556BE